MIDHCYLVSWLQLAGWRERDLPRTDSAKSDNVRLSARYSNLEAQVVLNDISVRLL